MKIIFTCFLILFQEQTVTDIIYEGTYCRSDFQALWVALVYIVKLPVIVVGCFLTHQIRHVTLPSLKDTTEVYVVIYSVVSLSVIGLPLFLTSGVAMTTRYIVGVLILFVVLTTTLTLLFIPKVLDTYSCTHRYYKKIECDDLV